MTNGRVEASGGTDAESRLTHVHFLNQRIPALGVISLGAPTPKFSSVLLPSEGRKIVHTGLKTDINTLKHVEH